MGVAWWAEFTDWLNRGIWSLFMHRAGHFILHFSQLPLLPYFSLTSLFSHRFFISAANGHLCYAAAAAGSMAATTATNGSAEDAVSSQRSPAEDGYSSHAATAAKLNSQSPVMVSSLAPPICRAHFSRIWLVCCNFLLVLKYCCRIAV